MPKTNTPLDTSPPRHDGDDVVAFTAINPLGIQDWYFEAISPPAYPLAYLRIDPSVAADAARLATDLPGWALIGRDSHPLDDSSEFLGYRICLSFQTSIAWSH
jgi:hypothetical protein